MLMTTVQLPGTEAYESQMAMHTSTANTDIILERVYQKHLSDPTQAHGLLDHSKDIKLASKQKCNNMDYRVNKAKTCHTY